MRAAVIYGLVFTAGAAIGGYVVYQLAQERVKDLAGGVIDSALGKGTWYGGVAKTFVNMFVEGS